MKQRQLGRGGPRVGEVGFGALSIAGSFGATDDATAMRTLESLQDLGVNHIDTALIYGPHTSEILVGKFLQQNPAARRHFTIATKGGFRIDPRGISNDARFLRECLESSLRRLGVDHVDLYYIHRRDQSIPIEDVTGTLVRFKDEGKIGGIGFSEISPASLERAATVHPIAAVQSEYSLWSRFPELGILQATARLGTAFVAFSPVARGVLTDVTLDPESFPTDDFRKPMPRFQQEAFARNMTYVKAFRAFAKSRGWATSTLAIAWVLHQAPHIIAIPGTRTAEHMAVDVKASDIHLSTDDLAEIEKILPPGWAQGNRYSEEQQKSSELYC